MAFPVSYLVLLHCLVVTSGRVIFEDYKLIGIFQVCIETCTLSYMSLVLAVDYQVTLAHLKDKPAPTTPTAPSSSFSTSSGVRSAAARLLGASNGSRLSFVGGNGVSKSVSASSRVGSLVASSSSNSTSTSNFDGKGSYLIFNVGDAIYISDLNTQDKVFSDFFVVV